MGVKFQSDQCYQALQKHMVDTIKMMQKAYLNEIASHMRTPEGSRDLTESDVEVLAGAISAQIIGGPWATMDQWGRGSLMDKSNPALADYINSQYWNPTRHDLAIRGRPEGTYTDIFGRTRRSTGKMEGKYLEHVFEPQPPSHAFTAATAWFRHTIIQDMMKDAINVFPFHKYIVVT